MSTNESQNTRLNRSSDIKIGRFRWERRSFDKSQVDMNHLTNLPHHEVAKLSFEKKQLWFRKKCDSLRISWTHGADWIRVNPDNILLNSMHQIIFCDLHKVQDDIKII